MCRLLAFSALADKQRHHVCEDPRSLGRALQIRRADEHPHAFQVKLQANVYVSLRQRRRCSNGFSLLLQGKNVTLPTGRAKPWAGKQVRGAQLFDLQLRNCGI